MLQAEDDLLCADNHHVLRTAGELLLPAQSLLRCAVVLLCTGCVRRTGSCSGSCSSGTDGSGTRSRSLTSFPVPHRRPGSRGSPAADESPVFFSRLPDAAGCRIDISLLRAGRHRGGNSSRVDQSSRRTR